VATLHLPPTTHSNFRARVKGVLLADGGVAGNVWQKGYLKIKKAQATFIVCFRLPSGRLKNTFINSNIRISIPNTAHAETQCSRQI
jgi:hypothetical protein